MGMHLRPRNKKAETFYMGAFSWGWMLRSGVGLCIGASRCPLWAEGGSMSIHDDEGRDPFCNDGYYVTADEARAMSHAAMGLANRETTLWGWWEAMPADTRPTERGAELVRRDFIEKAERFSQWAYQSHGFWIR